MVATKDNCRTSRRGPDPKILPTKFISDTALLVLALEEVLGDKTHFKIKVYSNAFSISSTTDQDIDMVLIATEERVEESQAVT
ncbi:hypothetical protein PspLS_04351 [Pyricularia sp. CBS 133598]|nr:hypothetical protein PspLS_04351 [Pyricularia sp. CBS 133598]